VTAESGIYKSLDTGSSWTFLGLPSFSISSIAVAPSNSKLLYAVTNDVGVVKTSTDGGLTWMDQPLPGTPVVNTLAVSKSDPLTVYAGTDNGLYKRGGDGVWSGPMISGRSVTSIATHPTRPDILIVGTTNGAFVSTDNGMSWQDAQYDLIGIHVNTVQFETGSEDPHWVYYATKSLGTLRAYIP